MNDDLDEEVMDANEGFDEFSQKPGLADTIRQSAVAKIGIIIAVVAVIIFILMTFGEKAPEQQDSFVPQGSDVTSVPSTEEEISPAYAAAVEQQNEEDLEIAIRQGKSAIPVPIETPDMRLEMPEIEEESEDPLHRWRALQEQRVEREMKTREADIEPITVLDAEQQSEAITNLSESMVEQMESVLSNKSSEKTFTVKTLLTRVEEQTAGAGANAGGAANRDGGGFVEDVTEEIVIPAGRIVYAQLLLEANSDVDAPVLAQMVSGMLHPDTTLAAMRTDINRRYLRRIIFPAAAAFVDGFAQAISETGQTEITISGDVVTSSEDEADNDQQVATGVTEAAGEIREILDEMGEVEVQIIIEAGTAMGVFFTENVVETESDI